jgi:hypothetical protein
MWYNLGTLPDATKESLCDGINSSNSWRSAFSPFWENIILAVSETESPIAPTIATLCIVICGGWSLSGTGIFTMPW